MPFHLWRRIRYHWQGTSPFQGTPFCLFIRITVLSSFIVIALNRDDFLCCCCYGSFVFCFVWTRRLHDIKSFVCHSVWHRLDQFDEITEVEWHTWGTTYNANILLGFKRERRTIHAQRPVTRSFDVFFDLRLIHCVCSTLLSVYDNAFFPSVIRKSLNIKTNDIAIYEE